MFAQIFALSSSGHVILLRDSRDTLLRVRTPDLFYKAVQQSGYSPFLYVEGIHFVSVQTNGLYFVCTLADATKSPSLATSFLLNLLRVIKDYCGGVNEGVLRANFPLVYELIDEVLDYGYIQDCSSEKLKPLVSNVARSSTPSPNLLSELLLQGKTKGSDATTRPIAISLEDDRSRINEVYLDLVERVVVAFNASGELTRADLFGKLIMKSYLKGEPEVQTALSSDLFIRSRAGEDSQPPHRDAPVIDDITFHSCVNQDSFDRDRSIQFRPSIGETTVLSYRAHDRLLPPFKIFTQVEEMGPKMSDLVIKLNPTFPSNYHAKDILLSFTPPTGIESVSFSLSTYGYDSDEEEGSERQEASYNRQHNKITWLTRKVQGASEQILRVKFNWDAPWGENRNILKEIGTMMLDFEVSMFLCSGLQIRYLKIMERSSDYDPDRWVRYLTQAESYQFRL